MVAMAFDVKREIRRAVDTGKVLFGNRSSEKSILNGKTQLIVISNNAPLPIKERMQAVAAASEIPSYEFNGTGLQLGSVCGKPFVISVMAVENSGKSKILNVVKGNK